MNITLICGHYLPKLGYIEVHLAPALADLGHTVSVVTTSAVPPYVGHLQAPLLSGNEMDGAVKVTRLQPAYSLGQVVIARGLKEAVLDTNPDLLIVIGLGKRFPKPVFGLDLPVISLFGDNHYSYADGSAFAKLKTKLQFALLKASTYKVAIERSAALVAYTPESFEAAAGMLGGKYAAKLRAQKYFISLGFDPAQFYFEPALRQKIRSEHDLTNGDRVLITSTRVVAEKGLEAVLPSIAALPALWQWWVVGGDGGAYATSFAEKALAALGPSRFRLFSYQDRSSLNALFHAADAALYTVPAISVFEVMGTGLPCMLPHVSSLSHVLGLPSVASAWEPSAAEALAVRLGNYDFSEKERAARAHTAVAHFAWESVAQSLMEVYTRQ